MGEVIKLRDDQKIFRLDPKMIEAVKDLKEFTYHVMNNPADVKLRGGVYKEIDTAEVFTVTLENVEIGFKVIRKPENLYTESRKVFIKLLGYTFGELYPEEKDPLVGAVIDILIDRKSAPPKIEVPDQSTLIFTQECIREDLIGGTIH